MNGKQKTVVLGTLAIALTSIGLGIKARPFPKSVAPESLTTCCGIIRTEDEQAGLGFFVKIEGSRTNLFFVTAQHVVKALQEKEGKRKINLNVSVKKKNSLQSVELKVLCDETTERESPIDIAVIRLPLGELDRNEFDVEPLIVRLPCRNISNSGAETSQLRAVDQNGFITSRELLALAVRAGNTSSDIDLSEIRIGSGHPSFLLYSSRKKWNVRTGSDVFSLVSRECWDTQPENRLFSVFLRKGSIAFFAEAPECYQPVINAEGKDHALLIIDCQAAKGDSGAPVFAVVKQSNFWGGICETPHLLGILTRVVTAKGDAQLVDLSVQSEGKETGRIKGSPVFTENTGLSVVVPVDFVAMMLME